MHPKTVHVLSCSNRIIHINNEPSIQKSDNERMPPNCDIQLRQTVISREKNCGRTKSKNG